MQCPNCGETATIGSRFCEMCGQKLAISVVPEAAATGGSSCRCGAAAHEVDAQGYCTGCGRHRAVAIRDHHEVTLSPELSGITDRGIRHAHNEDDLALAWETVGQSTAAILVVADGLSSAQLADRASTVAASTACGVLQTRFREQAEGWRIADGGWQQAMADTMRDSILQANAAVSALEYQPRERKDPPETTLVAALVCEERVVIGWVGDSRAYWIGPDEAKALTRDHSWVNDQVDSGEMTFEQAMQSRQAHAITKCLGLQDEDDPLEPSVVTLTLRGPGLLLLCSDGVWNYASAPSEIAKLTADSGPGASARQVAGYLVEFALRAGGQDNITAAVLLRNSA